MTEKRIRVGLALEVSENVGKTLAMKNYGSGTEDSNFKGKKPYAYLMLSADDKDEFCKLVKDISSVEFVESIGEMQAWIKSAAEGIDNRILAPELPQHDGLKTDAPNPTPKETRVEKFEPPFEPCPPTSTRSVEGAKLKPTDGDFVSVADYLIKAGFKKDAFSNGNEYFKRIDNGVSVSVIENKERGWSMSFYDLKTKEKWYYQVGKDKHYDSLMNEVYRLEKKG